MKARQIQKLLLVEGAKDRRIFPYLLERNGVPWPKGNEPVSINDIGGNELSTADASVFYKQPELEILGIVLDADLDVDATWIKVTQLFGAHVPKLPEKAMIDGFISELTPEGVRFGAWIMPDNQSRGMLETFLRYLVRIEHEQLWQHACDATDTARLNHSAPYKSVHLDKARIHTFLAWQDEPGAQLHEAINYAILDPVSPYCKPFVTCLKRSLT